MIGLALAMLLGGAADPHRYAGETYTCHFPKAGLTVIDTREPGSTVTWRGKVYPVTSGSYFYTNDGGSMFVIFGPNMRWWNFGEHDDRDNHCSVRKNIP